MPIPTPRMPAESNTRIGNGEKDGNGLFSLPMLSMQADPKEGVTMSKRIQLVPAAGRQPLPSLHFPAADSDAASGLELLAQLVEQIDDALLVVEHPHLAARVYATLRSTRAA